MGQGRAGWQQRLQGLPSSTGLVALLAVAFVAWGLLLGLLLARYAALTREIQDLHERQGLLEANGSRLATELTTLEGNQTQLHQLGVKAGTFLETLETNQSRTRTEVSRTMVALQRDRDRTRDELHRLLKALWEGHGPGCPVCPPGWQLNAGSCYAVGNGTAGWGQAQSACREQGAALATIGTSQEQAFVTTLVPRHDVWIGLHDRSTEGTFEWADGSPLSYQNWARQQPDEAGTGEDCVTMGVGGRWADRACASSPGGWLCERPWSC
ncbi:low affinity immunoglobulin epsilon Fc receptor-like [Apteryx mantelli]|uniref:low affinity immunoglobulin epsilon Fc receptor-like n=1 Tax=Apteryx mantelli TaxID=2696672 RepID=UPI00351B8C95